MCTVGLQFSATFHTCTLPSVPPLTNHLPHVETSKAIFWFEFDSRFTQKTGRPGTCKQPNISKTTAAPAHQIQFPFYSGCYIFWEIEEICVLLGDPSRWFLCLYVPRCRGGCRPARRPWSWCLLYVPSVCTSVWSCRRSGRPALSSSSTCLTKISLWNKKRG